MTRSVVVTEIRKVGSGIVRGMTRRKSGTRRNAEWTDGP